MAVGEAAMTAEEGLRSRDVEACAPVGAGMGRTSRQGTLAWAAKER
jgi:hypothetical protein